VPHPNKWISTSESSRVRQSSRGIGVRYLLALTLPITGVVLVLYTVAQLFGLSFRDARAAATGRVPAIAGSVIPSQPPPLPPTAQTASPRK